MGYVIAWLVWVSATALMMAGMLYLTRRWKPLFLRDLVRLVVAGTLLVPSVAGSYEGFYAPAWVVFLFEAFLQTEGDPVPAMMSLVVGWGLALAILLGLTGWRFRRRG